MQHRIGIILTTFLRDELMYRIVQSVIDNWNKDYILFVGNQSYKTDEEKLQGFSKFNLRLDNSVNANIKYYNLPYDCGLSYARNFLVQKANEARCDYIFLTADSYEFQNYNLTPIIKFLESSVNYGLVGFLENNKPDPKWCWDMELIPNQYFLLKKPNRSPILFQGLQFLPCDVTQNFYLAKTTMVKEVPHDNELKLCEHEDIMYRFGQAGWKLFFNDSIACDYINIKPSSYNAQRKRIYTEYKQKLLQKYHLQSWIKIER